MPKMSEMEEFLKADMVEQGDILKILDKGVIIPKELTRFKRTEFHVTVGLPDQSTKTWNPNKTTRDRFKEKWGDDSENFVGRSVKVTKEQQTVSGKLVWVLYGHPVEGDTEPKQTQMETPASKVIDYILTVRPMLNAEDVNNLVSMELYKAKGKLNQHKAAIIVAENLDIDLELTGLKVI